MEKIVGYIFWTFLILFCTYLGLAVAPPEWLPSIDRERIIKASIAGIAREAWSFSKPLLQLTFILLILGSVLKVLHERFSVFNEFKVGDVKSVLALLIIGSFCLAALSGSQTTGFLQDVALVVIGFYFGSQFKDSSLTTNSKSEPDYENTNAFK